jgi:dolichyl-phosphate mannosyltransferase polypeptide 2 regulatory subunit
MGIIPRQSSHPLPLSSLITEWSSQQPFIPSDSAIQSCFPDRIWAIRIPILLLLSGISGIGLFLGKVMLGEARKRSRAGKKV